MRSRLHRRIRHRQNTQQPKGIRCRTTHLRLRTLVVGETIQLHVQNHKLQRSNNLLNS